MPTKKAVTAAAANAAVAQWLTSKELADELKVPVDTVYVWRTKGTGPQGVPFGRHVRYARADVDKWIAAKYAACPVA